MADESIEKVVAAAVAEATQGLASKNAELLKDLKNQKEAFSEFEGVNIKELKSAADELKKIKDKKLEEDGEYKKMYEIMKNDHATEVEKLQNANKDLEAKLHDTTKSNALATALVTVNVIPELADVAVSTLKDKVAIDDAGNPIVGDKPVADYIKTWAATDVGKHFIRSGNSGGGGNGSEGGGVDSNTKYFDPKSKDFNLTAQAKLANSDPEAYKALKKQYPGSKATPPKE